MVAARGNPVEVRGEPIAVKPAGYLGPGFSLKWSLSGMGGKAARKRG